MFEFQKGSEVVGSKVWLTRKDTTLYCTTKEGNKSSSNTSTDQISSLFFCLFRMFVVIISLFPAVIRK